MKHVLFFLFFSINSVAQLKTNIVSTTKITADTFIGADFQNNLYYIKDNILYKETTSKKLTYTNYQFGKLSSVDIVNPLHIVLFYDEFNVAILLDNQLNQTSIIQFNSNITFARKGIANILWLFNSDSQQLEVYNYKTHTIENTSPPFNKKAIKKTRE